MIPVVDHESGHAAVDGNVLSVDEAVLLGAEEENRPDDVQGMADAFGGMLRRSAGAWLGV